MFFVLFGRLWALDWSPSFAYSICPIDWIDAAQPLFSLAADGETFVLPHRTITFQLGVVDEGGNIVQSIKSGRKNPQIFKRTTTTRWKQNKPWKIIKKRRRRGTCVCVWSRAKAAGHAESHQLPCSSQFITLDWFYDPPLVLVSMLWKRISSSSSSSRCEIFWGEFVFFCVCLSVRITSSSLLSSYYFSMKENAIVDAAHRFVSHSVDQTTDFGILVFPWAAADDEEENRIQTFLFLFDFCFTLSTFQIVLKSLSHRERERERLGIRPLHKSV